MLWTWALFIDDWAQNNSLDNILNFIVLNWGWSYGMDSGIESSHSWLKNFLFHFTLYLCVYIDSQKKTKQI